MATDERPVGPPGVMLLDGVDIVPLQREVTTRIDITKQLEVMAPGLAKPMPAMDALAELVRIEVMTALQDAPAELLAAALAALSVEKRDQVLVMMDALREEGE